jgi:pimeloyl-ACP methyl ester carboxylesterase
MTTEITTGTVRSADGTLIAYDRSGSGPALVLVDAACGFRGFGPMTGLAALLAPAFTVYVYDRRGRGGSTDTAPYAVDREVEDLAAVIGAAGGSAYVHGFSSGAVLALRAAVAGLPITKLSLLEPPLDTTGGAADEGASDLAAEVGALVAAGRRGDAVEHFQRGIGVPADMVAVMRQAPFWPTLESVAHTLAYDVLVAGSLPVDELAGIGTPTLVVTSESSSDNLRAWGRGVAEALPNGEHRAMSGEWHGVPDEDLTAALTGYFTADT